jgi:hypothetical protein
VSDTVSRVESCSRSYLIVRVRAILEQDDFTPDSYKRDLEAKGSVADMSSLETPYLDRLGIQPKEKTLKLIGSDSPEHAIPPAYLERRIRSDSVFSFASEATLKDYSPSSAPSSLSPPKRAYSHTRLASVLEPLAELNTVTLPERTDAEWKGSPLPTPLAGGLNQTHEHRTPPNAFSRFTSSQEGGSRNGSRVNSLISSIRSSIARYSQSIASSTATQGTFGVHVSNKR